MKNDISTRNPYYIPKYRYLELKNFCLQYYTWFSAYDSLDGLSKRPNDLALFQKDGQKTSPTERCVIAKQRFKNKIDMVFYSVQEACADNEQIAPFLLNAVGCGKSYNDFKNPQFTRGDYYRHYRKFFYILSKKRD